MRNSAIAGFAALALPVIIGCAREPKNALRSPHLAQLPIELTVKQRSTTDLPGSDGSVRLTIDDVTRNQVIVWVCACTPEGAVLLGPTSLAPDRLEKFRLDPESDESYCLKLVKLDNALIGDDYASFVVMAATTETTKIERLLETVESMPDVTFLRNGDEYGAREAAEFLRAKWKARDDEVATAREFIDEIATRSTITGLPYRVRRADGTTVLLGDLLRERLAEIESAD